MLAQATPSRAQLVSSLGSAFYYKPFVIDVSMVAEQLRLINETWPAVH